MAEPWVSTFVSVGVISLISFAGLVSVPFALFRKHHILFGVVALAAGTLLGNSFLHLLPEAVELWGEFSVEIALLVLGGFLAFYLLESLLRIGHAHGETFHVGHHEEGEIKPFGILNLVGDGVHNFLDGIVIAAAYLVDFNTGLATTLAVAIHEIPQEVGDFGVLIRAGFRPLFAAMFNLMSAVMAFAGAIVVLLLSLETDALEKFALPIVAGGFIYIAAADLIPELHHHSKARFVPAVMGLMTFGIGLMWLLTLMEA